MKEIQQTGLYFALAMMAAICSADASESIVGATGSSNDSSLSIASKAHEKAGSLLGVKKETANRDAIDELEKEFSAILEEFDPVSKEGQSRSFKNKLDMAAEKYSKSFPYGSISAKWISDIHIHKGCVRSPGFDKKKKKIYAAYQALCVEILRQAELRGVGARGKDRLKAEALIKLYVLVKNESNFDYTVCDSVSVISDESGRSRLCKDFLSKNEKIIKFYEEAAFDSDLFIRKAFIFDRAVDRLIVGLGQGVRKASPEEFASIEKSIQECVVASRKDGCSELMKYSLVHRMWVLRNISRRTQDEKMLKMVDDVLASIVEKAESLNMRNWAHEALSKEAEQDHVPKRVWMGFRVVGPDQKWWIDEDGDGKPDHPYDPKDYE